MLCRLVNMLTVSEYNSDQWYGSKRQTHYWLCPSTALSLSADICTGTVIIACSGCNKWVSDVVSYWDYTASVMNKWTNEWVLSTSDIILTAENRRIKETAVSVPLCLPQFPYGLHGTEPDHPWWQAAKWPPKSGTAHDRHVLMLWQILLWLLLAPFTSLLTVSQF